MNNGWAEEQLHWVSFFHKSQNILFFFPQKSWKSKYLFLQKKVESQNMCFFPEKVESQNNLFFWLMGERHLLSVVESFSQARQSRGLKMFWWNYNEGDEITPNVMKLHQRWWNYNEDDDYAWWENLRDLVQDYAQLLMSKPCKHSCYTNIFEFFTELKLLQEIKKMANFYVLWVEVEVCPTVIRPCDNPEERKTLWFILGEVRRHLLTYWQERW